MFQTWDLVRTPANRYWVVQGSNPKYTQIQITDETGWKTVENDFTYYNTYDLELVQPRKERRKYKSSIEVFREEAQRTKEEIIPTQE